jgi:WD40 repeat protein/energy-coupling factor transporter ATP-binding protein EcfA2
MFIESQINNPFPGLRAFEEDEDILFFGREKQIDELLTKLRTSRLIAVIGSSGSGKSSLVKSGLIPSLQSGFMSGRGSSWRICSFRPGSDPIGNMAKSLVTPMFADNDKEEAENIDTLVAITESVLRRNTSGLADAFKQSSKANKDNLLILVDQFEEIFRFRKFENESKQVKKDSITFINLLLAATKQSDLPIYVVFTMRADFLTDCTDFRGLPEAINDGSYLVPKMTREERREAIVGPISVTNSKINQHLLNQLLNDVGDNQDQLPILQHALMRTYEFWKQKNNPSAEIELNDYEAIGTMKYAISQHAEEAYAELKTDDERKICELIFKTLTDSTSDVRGIRRPSKMSELCEITNASFEEVAHVIEIFRKEGRAFLMPPHNTTLSQNSIIDISHESIMRVWVRLINWLEEEKQSSITYTRLSEASNLYELGNGGLLHDPELQIAWRWKESQNPNAKWASRFDNNFEKAMLYLNYSKDQNDLSILRKEELQKRRLRQARRILIFISAFTMIVIVLGIMAFDAKQKATLAKEDAIKQKKNAEAQTLKAISAEKEAERQKSLADLNKDAALKSKEDALNQKKNAEAQTLIALAAEKDAKYQKQIAETRKDEALKAKEDADIQRDIAKNSYNEAVKERKESNRLKELAEARNLAYQSTLKFNENKFQESIDKALLAFEKNEENKGPIQNSDIYNALSINWSKTVNNKNVLQFHKHPVRSLITKPNSNIVISGDESGIILVSKATEGILSPVHSFIVKNEIRSLSLTPNGKNLLILTTKGIGYLYGFNEDKNQFPLLLNFNYNGIGKTATFINNNEFYLITSQGLQKIAIENKTIKILESIQGNTFSNVIIGKKTQKIYVTVGNEIKIYDKSQNLSHTPNAHFTLNNAITSIDIDENEKLIAVGSVDGSIWMKELTTSKSPTTLTIHQSSVNDLKFGKQEGNNLQLASASADNLVKLIDVNSVLSGRNNEDVFSLRGHNLWVYKLCFLSNGKYLLSASEDERVISWIPSMTNMIEGIKKNNKK